MIASGIYGQNIYVQPADDLVIAKLSTWPTPLSPSHERLDARRGRGADNRFTRTVTVAQVPIRCTYAQ